MKSRLKNFVCLACALLTCTLLMPFSGFCAQDSQKNTVVGAALTLTDKISVTFYLDIKDRTAFTYFVLDGPNGRQQTAVGEIAAQTEGSTAGLCKLSYDVDVLQAAEKVMLTLKNGNETAALYKRDAKTRYDKDCAAFSVKDYISCVDADSGARKGLKALAQALDGYTRAPADTKARQGFIDASRQYAKLTKDGSTIDTIEITDTNGQGSDYSFVYNSLAFSAYYSVSEDGKENWKIIDSYKIRSKADIQVICKALISIHPVHGRDMVSFRTARDMADEWELHNLAYDYLPEGNSKNRAKDVDLDPDDQGKGFGDFVAQILSGG